MKLMAIRSNVNQGTSVWVKITAVKLVYQDGMPRLQVQWLVLSVHQDVLLLKTGLINAVVVLKTGTMTMRPRNSAKNVFSASINQLKVPRRVKNVMLECTFQERWALACAPSVKLACSVRHQDQLALTVAWVSTGRQTSKHAHHVQQENGATRPS